MKTIFLISRIIFSAVFCLLVLTGGLTVAADIDQRVFEQAARMRTLDYALVRDSLVKRGKTILPLLEKKLTSDDWQERMFAKILIARIKKPESVKKWNRNLLELVKDYTVRKALKAHPEPEWKKLPTKAADVPASHVIDVFWQHYRYDGERITAGAILQFYLAPDIDSLDAVMDHLTRDYVLRRAAGKAILKLGKPTIPRMRQALVNAISWNATLKGSGRLTPEDRKIYWKYRQRVEPAAFVLSRLNDTKSVPLILKCLKLGQREWSYFDYFKKLSESLAHMKAVPALDTMIEYMLRSGAYRGQENFSVLRSHVASFGNEALPPLEKYLKTAKQPSDKILLTNLIYELSRVEGKKKKIAQLHESVWFKATTAKLLELHELTGEDIFGRLQILVKGDRYQSKKERTPACLALGDLKEKRAIPMLRAMIQKQHESLESRKRRTKEDAKPFDPQAAREAGYTFGYRQRNIAEILSWGDTLLLTLRRIGRKEARAAIAASATYPEYEARAEISLLFMDGKLDQIARHLENKDRTMREEAAFALLKQNNERATRELVCAAARRHGPNHDRWMQYAYSSRDDIIPVLRDLIKSKNVRERVLAEAIILKEQLQKKMEKVLKADAIEDVGHVPFVPDETWFQKIRDADENEPYIPTYYGFPVEKLDESHLPLVEAECLFGTRRRAAAFTLAKFKKPRSMKVLVEALNMGESGPWRSRNKSNAAAVALADFGKEGARLAAMVPPPLPGQHDTGRRMTRHRGGVRVLAEHKDIRGVDEILKGLKTLENDRKLDLWSHRLGVYLSAAGRFHDVRLVEPLLRILNAPKDPYRPHSHRPKVIKLLSAYDDPRLVPLFTKLLATLDMSVPSKGLYGAALTALVRRLRDKTPEHLIKQYKESKNDTFRRAVLLALGELSYSSAPPYPGDGRWWGGRFKEKDARIKAAKKARKLAFPFLVAALDDPVPDVNQMAAVSLTILASGSAKRSSLATGIDDESIGPDLKALKPLTEWCCKQKQCFYSLAKYLGKHGNKETGQALLGLLKSLPPTEGTGYVMDILRKLKPEGMVPVLVRNVKAKNNEKFRKQYSYPTELSVLADFGDEGAEALLDIFKQTDNQDFRVKCAWLLAVHGRKEAVDPVAELLSKVIKAGPNNPELIPGSDGNKADAFVLDSISLLHSLKRLAPEKAKKVAQRLILDGPEDLKLDATKVYSQTMRLDKEIIQKQIRLAQPLVKAIELYKEDKGEYPKSIDDVVPKYLHEIPKPVLGDSDKWFYARFSLTRFQLAATTQSNPSVHPNDTLIFRPTGNYPDVWRNKMWVIDLDNWVYVVEAQYIGLTGLLIDEERF